MSVSEKYQQIKRSRQYPYLHQWLGKWHRQPKEQWLKTRSNIWKRDKGLCMSPESASPKREKMCELKVSLDDCHVDHIQPISSFGSNHASNLRTLCPICHGLRGDKKHKSMRSGMVKKGTIPVDYSHLIWDF